jgi:hypothetical protein
MAEVLREGFFCISPEPVSSELLWHPFYLGLEGYLAGNS